MKKILLKGITALLLGSAVVSCDKGFDELNVSPNDPSAETASPKMLLTPTLKDGIFSAHLHQRIHNLYIDNYAQYYNGPIAGVQRGNVADGWSQDYWRDHYKWINNLNTIIRLYKDTPAEVNTVATAMVWKSFLYVRLTDMFGDVPYSQAADGTGNLPVYDTQESIYKDILTQLETAVAMFDESQPTVGSNDFIYGGDIQMWKKFTNSLRLRYAMRISSADVSGFAKTHAENAVAGGVLESNNDSPLMVNVGSPWGQGYSTKYYFDWGPGNGVGLTTTMYNMLVGFGTGFPDAAYFGADALNDAPSVADPRAPHYFWTSDQNSANLEDGYKGNWTAIDNGISVDDEQNADNFVVNNSRVSPEMHGDITRSLIIMPASEIWFLRAEGALKGWDMGVSDKVAYENGISISMDQWGETSATADYLTSTNANLNGTTVSFMDDNGTNNSKLDKIITQKYISGFPDNGWEAWADQRRLDHSLIQKPINVDPGTGLSVGDYVQRIKYPSNQPSVNGDNYADAVARQGVDLVSTKIWWAK